MLYIHDFLRFVPKTMKVMIWKLDVVQVFFFFAVMAICACAFCSSFLLVFWGPHKAPMNIVLCSAWDCVPFVCCFRLHDVKQKTQKYFFVKHS